MINQRRKCTPVAASILFLAGAAIAGPAGAIDKIASGDWHTAALWEPKFVPTLSDGADIYADTSIGKAAAASAISLNSDLEIGGDVGYLGVTNSIQIGTTQDYSGSLTVQGKLEVPLQVGRHIVVGRMNQGTMEVTNGQVRIGQDLRVGGTDIVGAHLLQGEAFGKLTLLGPEASISAGGSIGVGREAGFGQRLGNGEVLIGDGARLATGGGAIMRGEMIVQGTGTVWTIYGLNSIYSTGDLLVKDDLTIENDADVNFDHPSGDVFVSGAGAKLTVDGSGSTLIGANTFQVGGDLTLSRGGFVRSNSGLVREGGNVRVSGAGSYWQIDGRLDLNNYSGDSRMTVEAGGVVLANDLSVGNNNGSVARLAELTLTGEDSGMVVVNQLAVGRSAHSGRILVNDGAQLTSGTGAIAGDQYHAHGEVRVDGVGSSWQVLDVLTVGAKGTGAVTVTNGGTLNARIVDLGRSFQDAVNNGAQGSLNIGADAQQPAAAAGTLDIEDGIRIARTGTLVFNHTEAAYAFRTTMASLGEGDGLMEHRAGTTILDADLANFTGQTRVIGGMLVVNSTLGSDVTVESGAVLAGSGTILGDLVALDGSAVLPGNSPGMLTVDGDFTVAPGGMLTMEINGPDPGSQHDVVDVGGNLTLTGSELHLIFGGNFAPSAGQQFNLFKVGGSFSQPFNIVVDGLLAGWEFNTAFDAGTGVFALRSLNDGIAQAPVPLPAGGWLMAGGLAMLVRQMRVSRHRNA